MQPEEGNVEGQPAPLPWRIRDVVLAVGAGLVLGFLLVIIFAGIYGAVTGSAEDLSSTLANAIATSIVYAALFFTVYLLIIVRRKVSWSAVGMRQPDKGFFWMTIGVWVATIIATVIVGVLVSALFGDPPDVREQLQVTDTNISGAEMFWLLIASVVAAPLVEEIVFRGLLFSSLRRRWPFWAAALVSAVVFAAAHGTLILLPALTVLGFSLAWLRERYDSIYPAIVLHGLNNGLAIAIFLSLTSR